MLENYGGQMLNIMLEVGMGKEIITYILVRTLNIRLIFILMVLRATLENWVLTGSIILIALRSLLRKKMILQNILYS